MTGSQATDHGWSRPAALLPAVVVLGLLVLVWAATTGPVRMLHDSGRRYVFAPPPDRPQRPRDGSRPAPRCARSPGASAAMRPVLAGQPDRDAPCCSSCCVLVFLVLRWVWLHRWRPPERPRGGRLRRAPGPRWRRRCASDARRPAARRSTEGSPRNGDRGLLAAAPGGGGRGRGAAAPRRDVRGVRGARAARPRPRPAGDRGRWPRSTARPGSPSTTLGEDGPATTPGPPCEQLHDDLRCPRTAVSAVSPRRERSRRAGGPPGSARPFALWAVVVGDRRRPGQPSRRAAARSHGRGVRDHAVALPRRRAAVSEAPRWDLDDDDPVRPPGEDPGWPC